MLFIPGFMQRGDAWRPVAELLPERYPSRLLDHAEHSFEGRLGEIAEAGADVLVGYSLGGRLALRAALRSPESFTGVVVVGSTAGIEEGPMRVQRVEADEKLASWIEAMPIEDIVALWERQPLFADQSDLLVEEQRPGRLSQDPRSLALLLRTAGQGTLDPVWHELRSSTYPCSPSRALATTATARRRSGSPRPHRTPAPRSWRRRATRRSCSSRRRWRS